MAVNRGTLELTLKDNSGLVINELQSAVARALERCGEQAETYAKELCPVDTGNLRNSIAHTVDTDGTGGTMTVGSATSYATYVEMGTGIYAENGDGRPTPWVYKDDKGNWHWTQGNRAQPFIKPAVADHAATYEAIIADELKK